MTLLLPGYFDPVREAGDWDAVLGAAGAVRAVVLNPASGAGAAPLPEYAALAARLRGAAIRFVGYVDTDYGRRSADSVRAEVARWRDWYDVDGVFLDQSRADLAGLDLYERHVGEARALGCRTVVLNPGCYPDEAYAHLANLVVVFEGDAAQHRRVVVPSWVRRIPAERFCHLVHGVSADGLVAARSRTASWHAGSLYVTDQVLPNPWGRLAPYWTDLVETA